MPDAAPALSYVVRADDWSLVADVAASLSQQDASGLELLVVSRREMPVPEGAPAPAVRVLLDRTHASWAASLARGVHASTAEFVALGETHVRLAPTWARAVLARHREGADVVLPLMVNANPDSALSEAAFVMDYGRYARSGPCARTVPVYNASFRRSLLLAESSLAAVLTPGPALDELARSRGAAVVSDPGARVSHLNVALPGAWADERFCAGLLMAERRCSAWPFPRRLLYAVAFPAIAATLFRRARRFVRADAPGGSTAALAAGCVLYAVGEACGYMRLPTAASAARMERYETHKRLFLGTTA